MHYNIISLNRVVGKGITNDDRIDIVHYYRLKNNIFQSILL